METGRVVIDTEDLRELVRFTGGAVERLGDIRLDLVRAHSLVSQNTIAENEYATVLAGVDALGSVLEQDRIALIGEVTTVEAEEGMPAAEPWRPPPTEAKPAAGGDEQAAPASPLIITSAVMAVALGQIRASGVGVTVTSPPLPPPPWNQGWVDPDGTVPTDAPMTRTAVHDEFGSEWSDATSDKYGSASGRASTSGWVSGEAEAGKTDSGYAAKASAKVGTKASFEGEAEAELGDLKIGASGGGSVGAEAEGEAHVSLGKDGAHVGAKGSAKAYAETHGEAHVALPGAEGKLSSEADAYAEAHGEASFDVGPDGVGGTLGTGAGTGASAGGKGELTGPGSTKVKAGMHGSVGIGISLNTSFHFGCDELSLDFGVGAILGIGGGFDLGLSISPKEIFEGLGDVLTDPLGALEDLAETVGDTVGDVVDAISDLFGAGGNSPDDVTDGRWGAGVGVSLDDGAGHSINIGISADDAANGSSGAGVGASADDGAGHSISIGSGTTSSGAGGDAGIMSAARSTQASISSGTSSFLSPTDSAVVDVKVSLPAPPPPPEMPGYHPLEVVFDPKSVPIGPDIAYSNAGTFFTWPPSHG